LRLPKKYIWAAVMAAAQMRLPDAKAHSTSVASSGTHSNEPPSGIEPLRCPTPRINLADELGLSRGQLNANLFGSPCRVLKWTHTEIAWSEAVPINWLMSV
jgi:hypothetical protein